MKISEFIDWHTKAVAFHPYTSRVFDKIFSINKRDFPLYNALKESLIKDFNSNEIKAWNDNKIVFEVSSCGHHIFYGFYDGVFSIGFSVRSR
jgi:hypothetical protein